MATTKNDIISQLSDCSSSSDEYFYIRAEHQILSSSSRKSWTPQHERKREMEKEKRDEAFAKSFGDPSFPLFFIGSTSGSCAGVA